MKGLVANLAKPRALQVAADLAAWLSQRGIEPALEAELGRLLAWPGRVMPLEQLAGTADLLFVLGGDGTILATAKQVAPYGTALLGINLGHRGFLTEVEEVDLYQDLPEFLAGRSMVDERSMLAARLVGGGAEELALNEVAVASGRLARTVRLRVAIDGVELAAYAGDGVIVASPTGSTAYSLAAGGPVLHPGVAALVVTPICPISARPRPTVVAGQARVQIEVTGTDGEAMLTFDGQEGRRLRNGERVEVTLARHTVRLVRRTNWSFYRLLRLKLAETAGWEEHR